MKKHPGWLPVTTLVLLACATDALASQLKAPPGLNLAQSPRIALADGLTIVNAVVEQSGDYEVVMRISTTQPERILVAYSASMPVNGKPTELRGQRTVLSRDLQSARTYRIRWLAGRNELARGTTALGLSKAVFEEVRNSGRSDCSLASVEQADSAIGALGLPSPEYEGLLQRVEAGPVPVPVVVDGQREWLPAIHARGTFQGLTGQVKAEFWFLDNPDNPLTLRMILGNARLVVVRIDRPSAEHRKTLEQALAGDEKIDLPGIYFEFASARLRPESDAAIAEVAGVLRRHPDWKVRLSGHTDNIGGADANLALSRERAAAVRQAIAQRLGDGGARLETAGFGSTAPRESNDTPEGRARNRRVEIARLR
jgi:outer membrane protein OmpA-like peptidoglycan-associated protein